MQATGSGYGVPSDLFVAVTVPVPLTVQPMALVVLMATPPSRLPRMKLTVPDEAEMPAAPEVLTPSQLLTLTALRPLADVLNPRELLTLNDEMPMPLSGFVIVGWNPGVDRLPRRGDGLGSLNIERGFGWWRKADQTLPEVGHWHAAAHDSRDIDGRKHATGHVYLLNLIAPQPSAASISATPALKRKAMNF